MDAKAIGKLFVDINKEIYGKGEPNNIFNGGNVGLILLGLSIEKAVDKLANAIDKNTQMLEKIRREQ